MQYLKVLNPVLQPEGRLEKKVIEKRVRVEKEPLENMLFRLFERQVRQLSFSSKPTVTSYCNVYCKAQFHKGLD